MSQVPYRLRYAARHILLLEMPGFLTLIALRKPKIVYNFGLSACNRVNGKNLSCISGINKLFQDFLDF